MVKTAPCSSQYWEQIELLKYGLILLDKHYLSDVVGGIFFQLLWKLGGPGTNEGPVSQQSERWKTSSFSEE